MTWLGKILTFVVMLTAVVWMYFTVQAYATRTNWKTGYETYKDAYTKAVAARTTEFNRNQTNEDALKRLLINEQTKSAGLQKQYDTLAVANKQVVANFVVLQKAFDEGDVKVVLLQANVDSTLKELDAVRVRNTALEDQMTKLVIAAEDAKREMVRAQNAAKLSQSIADDLGKKVEELQAAVTEMKQYGGDTKHRFDKPPPDVLSNTRGEVERVSGDLVILSIGVDAGLSIGSVFDLSRLEGGGQYLGTVKVIDLTAKTATAVFTPKRAVRVDQLRPEELPKKGDRVRPQEATLLRK
jgi:hypothetical protein